MAYLVAGDVHDGKIVDNPFADKSKFQLKAVCSCQWEALAVDRFQAMSLLRQHLYRNGVPIEQLPDANSAPGVSEKKGSDGQ